MAQVCRVKVERIALTFEPDQTGIADPIHNVDKRYAIGHCSFRVRIISFSTVSLRRGSKSRSCF